MEPGGRALTINYEFEAEPGFWLDVDSAVSGQFRP
jgi:hypothetical protein